MRWRDFLAAHAALVAQGVSREALAEHRRQATRRDPLLFALVYLSRHLTDTEGNVTLSDMHVAWAKSAKRWMRRDLEPMEERRVEIAPRESGKSTFWFLLLPMWAAAHEHAGFAAAFADTDTQAQTHLATFKSELDNNALLRNDYPDLVAPKTRGRGQVEADRVSLYHARSGFVFAAAGIDASNLGMKVGDRRPDLIILDDIEPHEGRYSAALAEKRLATLRQAILPLNIRARVVWVGTVTMAGSLVHNVVQRTNGSKTDENAWVKEERFRGRHWKPILEQPDGTRASLWPAKWPLEMLLSIEHTRGYALNYANDPIGRDGGYWTMEVFRPLTDETADAVTHEVIEIDPAVTTKKSSDFTAIAAVGWARSLNKAVVFEARKVKAGPDQVRLIVLGFVERALARGHAVIVRVESNQGGDLWQRIFWGLPVPVKGHPAGTESKEVRAADALDHYQRGRVEHAEGLRDAEVELVGFPDAPHDDMVDAIGAGVRYFLSRDGAGKKKKAAKPGAASVAYAR